MKKNKKRNSKSLNSITYQSFCKSYFLKTSTSNYDKQLSGISVEIILDVINDIKDMFYDSPKDDIYDVVDETIFVNLVNLIEESIILYKVRNFSSIDSVKYIKSKLLVDMVSESKALGLTAAIINSYHNIYGFYTTLDNSKEANIIVKAILRILYGSCLYTLCFAVKFKNKKFKELTYGSEEGLFEILYKKDEMLSTQNMISILNMFSPNHTLTLSIREKAIEFSNNFSKVFYNFSIVDIPKEFEIQNTNTSNIIYSNYLIKDGFSNFPLKEHFESLLSMDNILSGIENKRFLIPPNGVMFKTIDKESDVHSLEILDRGRNLYIILRLRNKGNIKLVKEKDSSNANVQALLNAESNYIDYTEDIFESKFKVIKDWINETDYCHCIGMSSNVPSKVNTISVINDIKHFILACIYMAYVNPLLCQDVIKPYNRQSSLCEKSDVKRGSFYKTAYIRKLPDGQKISKTAIEAAREEGIANIPEGYTFVRASNIYLGNSAPKKVIKI